MLKTAMKDMFALYDTLMELNNYYVNGDVVTNSMNFNNVPGFITSAVNRACIYVDDSDGMESLVVDNILRIPVANGVADKLYVVVTESTYTHVEHGMGKFVSKTKNDMNDIFEPVYVIFVPKLLFEEETQIREIVKYLNEIFFGMLEHDINLINSPTQELFTLNDKNVTNYDIMAALTTITIEALLISKWLPGTAMAGIEGIVDRICDGLNFNENASIAISGLFKEKAIDNIEDVKNLIASNDLLLDLINS